MQLHTAHALPCAHPNANRVRCPLRVAASQFRDLAFDSGNWGASKPPVHTQACLSTSCSRRFGKWGIPGDGAECRGKGCFVAGVLDACSSHWPNDSQIPSPRPIALTILRASPPSSPGTSQRRCPGACPGLNCKGVSGANRLCPLPVWHPWDECLEPFRGKGKRSCLPGKWRTPPPKPVEAQQGVGQGTRTVGQGAWLRVGAKRGGVRRGEGQIQARGPCTPSPSRPLPPSPPLPRSAAGPVPSHPFFWSPVQPSRFPARTRSLPDAWSPPCPLRLPPSPASSSQ